MGCGEKATQFVLELSHFSPNPSVRHCCLELTLGYATMKLSKHLAAGAAALAMTVALGGAAFAQETTSDMRGVVTTESGAPLANATVIVIDTRTGQTRTVTTDENGSFSLRNLPVGGPYTVSAASGGYQGERVEGVDLGLGETQMLTFDLAEAGDTGDEIIIVGQRGVVANVAPGPSAVFDVATLDNFPAVDRDIKDIIRMDPRIYIDETFSNGIQCAGNNNRYNSLTVDGTRQNDDFGLNGNGYPTQRLPFPFDIVQAISVELAPIDVEYGGFTGCNINIVTRSGGNEFKGRLSYEYIGGDYIGDSLEGSPTNLTNDERKSYSGYLSGPIVPDRVFFSFAYEKTEEAGSSSDTGPLGSGLPNELPEITAQDVTDIQNIAQSVYNFDAGIFGGNFPVEDERYFTKVVALLNDNHRVELSYQDTIGNNIRVQNTGFRRLGLSSNWYNRTEEMKVYTGRLYSDWTDNFSTEIRITKQERVTGQDSLGGADFAQFEITTAGGGRVYLGSDPFRQANALQGDIMDYKILGEYNRGDHVYKFGYERNEYDVFNLFVPFSEGLVECASIADFQNQTCSLDIYSNAPSNDSNDGSATWDRNLNTVYVQDSWAWRPNVDLTLGLRYDWYDVDAKPEYNVNFHNRYGIRNDDTLDGKGLLQPRVGFEWEAADDLRVYGGVGVFSGGDPAVWVSNAYSNDGFLGFTFSGDLTGFDGVNLPQPILDAVTASGSQGQGRVDALDPNYKIPSIVRTSLGFEKVDIDLSRVWLGEGWDMGVDLLHSVTNDPVVWENLSLRRIGIAPDGRPIYQGQDLLDPDCPDNVLGSGISDLANCSVRRDDILLTNSSESPVVYTLSTWAKKEWTLPTNTDVDLQLGYAYLKADDVSPATSSTATSNFENIAVRDYNNPVAATSDYETTHRFTARVQFEHEFAPEWTTRLAFFGQMNSGSPYSYTFDTNCGSDARAGACNMFGDSDDSERRSLLYVPNGGNDPLIDTVNSDPTALTDYLNFIAANDELSEYAGRIVPRNAFFNGWWGKVDMRLQQEIPLPKTLGNDRLRVSLDVRNVGNLINDEWGIFRERRYNDVSRVALVEAELNPAGTQYVITDFYQPQDRVNTRISTWSAKVGVRYDF